METAPSLPVPAVVVAIPPTFAVEVVSRRATVDPEELAKKIDPLPDDPAVVPAAWKVRLPEEVRLPPILTNPEPEGVMFTFWFDPPEERDREPEEDTPLVVRKVEPVPT